MYKKGTLEIKKGRAYFPTECRVPKHRSQNQIGGPREVCDLLGDLKKYMKAMGIGVDYVLVAGVEILEGYGIRVKPHEGGYVEGMYDDEEPSRKPPGAKRDGGNGNDPD